MTPTDDRTLSSLVDAYARWPRHWTATLEMEATRAWFADELRRRGAMVDEPAYGFDRYRASWEMVVGGRLVESLPVFYQAVGRATSTAPFVRRITVRNAAATDELEAAISAAREAGAGLAVLPVFGALPSTEPPVAPYGALLAVNRAPCLQSGPHVLLLSGELAEEVEAGPVEARIDASIVADRDRNVVGWLGTGPIVDPVVVTTLLSGWFRCAGERGTGIAIALGGCPGSRGT